MTNWVTCVGISHRKVITREKKEYEFYTASFTYDDEYLLDGVNAISVSIPDSVASQIKVGSQGYLVTTWSHGKQYYDAFIPSSSDKV